MQATYDATSDALWIGLGTGERPTTREIAPGVAGDFDHDGRLVGIEVLGASLLYPETDFTTLPDARTWLSLTEASTAAEIEGESISPATLRKLCQSDRIPEADKRKQLGAWQVSRSGLWTYLESRSAAGRPSPKRDAVKRRARRRSASTKK